MDFDRLDQIVRWLARTPLQELEISDGEVRIRLRKGAVEPPVRRAHGVAAATPIEAPAIATAEPAPPDPSPLIRSPLYGICYLSPSAGEPPFVAPGQRISAGQTICIVEAMKMFNPVQSDADGVIAEILVASGDEVTVGQPLLRIER
jgi:acetyl-CoA carboxylase biotin carboxyl carrier protein